jgi:hypothetical protein
VGLFIFLLFLKPINVGENALGYSAPLADFPIKHRNYRVNNSPLYLQTPLFHHHLEGSNQV